MAPRHIIFPNSFSDDVKPHPLFIPPDENAFGKITHGINIENVLRIESPDTQLSQSIQSSEDTLELSKLDRQGANIKDELIGDEGNKLQRSTSTSFGKHSLGPESPIPIGTQVSKAVNPDEDIFKWFNNRERRFHDYDKCGMVIEYSNLRLRSHQAYARLWMADRESNGRNGGIVADEMGLGKTIQTLVRIYDDKLRALAAGEKLSPTLIVGPKSILIQWDEEIQRFFLPDKKPSCIIYHGPNRDVKYILSVTFCIDEAHEIRNVSTKKAQAAFAVNAEHRWCLTGTPVQNRISDLFSLFHFLRVKNFSNAQWFRSNIEYPVTKNDKKDVAQANRLLKLALSHIMLRRLKTDYVNGLPILVLPELKIQVRHCDLSTPEREFYDALKARMQDVLGEVSKRSERGNLRLHSTAWVLVLRLQQVLTLRPRACAHPALLADQTKVKYEDGSENDNKCPLCSVRLGGSIGNESASHREACVRFIETAKRFGKNEPSSKITTALNILREIKARPGNEKTIIFSQFTSVLNLIEPFLKKQDIRFSRLDGMMDMKKRNKKLNALQTDPDVTVVLISLMAGGTGLNITTCNNIVLFDLWWNPAVEEQAFARAHRIGQSKTVNVYKLITQDTVEMRIMELQDKKRKLALNALVWDDHENIKELSNDEISQLLG
ncbi:P-loop containing nucleoside triphosphate hydrolase protein [Lentinula edodes]|nr:P-loop containing nucleoside triphosphate hydrolase protein [Lentinula edodes]